LEDSGVVGSFPFDIPCNKDKDGVGGKEGLAVGWMLAVVAVNQPTQERDHESMCLLTVSGNSCRASTVILGP
jgi:hypothetical protein